MKLIIKILSKILFFDLDTRSNRKITMFLFQIFRWMNKWIPKQKKILAFVSINEENTKYTNDNIFLMCDYFEKNKNRLSYKVVKVPSITLDKIELLKIAWHILTAKIFIHKAIYCYLFYLRLIDSKQIGIILSYGSLFKASLLAEKNCAQRHGIEYMKRFPNFSKNTNIKYITTSKYSSRVVSEMFGFPLENCMELGMARNEKLIHSKKNQFDIEKIFDIPFKPKFIILYTPTFRDKYFDSFVNPDFSKLEYVFGYEDIDDSLEKLLTETNTIIIINLHKLYPLYQKLEEKLMGNYLKNCYFFSKSIKENYKISIYDLFYQSDAMISDYSSISFDYLLLDKPIIYNIHDFEEYDEHRGFAHYPVKDIMGGAMVKTSKDFLQEIKNVTLGIDNFKSHRRKVNKMVNETPTEGTMENIFQYILHQKV